jgi:small subunit ribosomal protein S4
MAKRQAKARTMRRFGENLTRSPKYAKILEKRPYPPGEHGPKARRKRGTRGPYAEGLIEKQKLKVIYDISETQLRRYVREAIRSTRKTGEVLLQNLERRLDNAVYRLGYAPTIWAARQLVSHGHVLVGGKRISVRSYRVRPGEVVTVSERMKKNVNIQAAVDLRRSGRLPDYLSFDEESWSGSFSRIPARSEIPVPVNETAVVEFYAR